MTPLLVIYLLSWAGILAWTFTPYGTGFFESEEEPWNWFGLGAGILLSFWLLDLAGYMFSASDMIVGTPWGRAVRLMTAGMGAVVGWRTQPISSAIGVLIVVLIVAARVLLVIVEYIGVGKNTLPELLEFMEKLKFSF